MLSILWGISSTKLARVNSDNKSIAWKHTSKFGFQCLSLFLLPPGLVIISKRKLIIHNTLDPNFCFQFFYVIKPTLSLLTIFLPFILAVNNPTIASMCIRSLSFCVRCLCLSLICLCLSLYIYFSFSLSFTQHTHTHTFSILSLFRSPPVLS